MARERKSSSKRLTGAQWEEVKLKWRSGKYTLKELAAEYDMSAIGIQSRLKRNNIVKGEDAQMADRKLAEASAIMRAEMAAKEEKALRETATGLKKFLLNSANVTVKRLMSEMATQATDRKSLSHMTDDAKAAKEITIVLKNIADVIEKVVPGVALTDDDLPELLIAQMTDQEIEEAQKGGVEDDLEDLNDELDATLELG